VRPLPGLVVVVLLLAAVAVAVWGLRAPAAKPSAHGIVTTTQLSPRAVEFGDVVTATLDVTFGSLSPAQVTALPDVFPYHIVSSSRQLLSLGDRRLLRFRWQLDCLSLDCLPDHFVTDKNAMPQLTLPQGAEGPPVAVYPKKAYPSLRYFGFQPAVIIYHSPSGLKLQAAQWQPLTVSSRLTPLDLQSPAFEHSSDSPSVYSSWTAWLFLALAGALALAALPFARRHRPALAIVTESVPSPRDQALATLEALAAPPQVWDDDKAAAIERLAVELVDGQPEFASRLRRLAWARERVDTAALRALLDEIVAADGEPAAVKEAGA